MMKTNIKKFEQPVIETIVYECVDIITTSSPSFDDEGFNNEVVKP